MKDTKKIATQALHRIQEQAAREKLKARKERTRRLIVEGAILEKALPIITAMSLPDLEAFLNDKLHAADDDPG